jgi:anti-sigma B factor antagonist
MGGIEVTTSPRDGGATVVVDGELDIATAPQLEAALRDAESRGVKALFLDLGGLAFMDSTGLRSVLAAHQRAQAEGRQLTVQNLQPEVARVLEVTGADRILALAP